MSYAHAALPPGTSSATLYTGAVGSNGISWCGACSTLENSAGFSSIKTKLGANLRTVEVASDFSTITNSTNFPAGVQPTVSPSNSYPSLALQDATGNQVGDVISGPSAISTTLQELGNQVAPEQRIICIVPRPGQTDGSFQPPAKESVSYKGNAGGYGNVTDQPGQYPISGTVPDTQVPIIESPTNFKLRRSGSPTMDLVIDKAVEQKVEGAKTIVILPSEAQAEEFLTSASSNRRGSYTINGVSVAVGKYNAKQLDPTTGIIFDEDCNPTKKEVPTQLQNNNPQQDQLGGFGGGGNGGGSLGNLGSNPLLPLLMQGLLGQGLGGGQGGQNPYGNQNNPYNNPYTQRANCATQGTSPVCGTDGRSYTNICYLQQSSVQLRTYGVCPTVTPTPSPIPTTTPNPTTQVTSILNQLTTSGIPTSLIESLRNTISSILSSILSGGANMGETIIR